MRPILIDTDVLIWKLRGNANAAERLDQAGGFVLSAVSYMELIQGVRDKAEENTRARWQYRSSRNHRP